MSGSVRILLKPEMESKLENNSPVRSKASAQSTPKVSNSSSPLKHKLSLKERYISQANVTLLMLCYDKTVESKALCMLVYHLVLW